MNAELEFAVIELESAPISVEVDDDDAALGFDVVGSIED